VDGSGNAVLTRSQSASPRPLTKGAGVLCLGHMTGTPIADEHTWRLAGEAEAVVGLHLPVHRRSLPGLGLALLQTIRLLLARRVAALDLALA